MLLDASCANLSRADWRDVIGTLRIGIVAEQLLVRGTMCWLRSSYALSRPAVASNSDSPVSGLRASAIAARNGRAP
ncbi:MAG: hypothetical protein E5W69_12450, partial [Mesorhizobium sp.]